MLMPKYDRSSITLRIPHDCAESGSRQVNTLTKNHGVLGVFGRIFSLFVVRTVRRTTFRLWGKRNTETKIRPTPPLNAFVYFIARSWLYMTNRVSTLLQDI